MTGRAPVPGLRREAPILLAAALTLFVVLSGVTLYAYRSAIARLERDRSQEALSLARRLAEEAAGRAPSRLGELARELPVGVEAALLDAEAHALATAGASVPLELAPEQLGELLRSAPAVLGPRRSGIATIVAIAPLRADGQPRWLRLTFPAEGLATETRALSLLTPLVLGSLILAGIVVGLFFRAYSRPYRTLLERARAAGAPDAAQDELDFLVATFDRALGDLSGAERERARAGLAEVVAQLGELAAGVAHELRNSVAAMRGWIDLARREPLSARASQCLAELDHESRNLGRVTEDFLAFARPGSGRLEELDLAEVARAAAVDPARSGVEILVAGAPSTLRVLGDRNLLERALRNLLANAVEATRDAGKPYPVEIELSESPGHARVRISDRGAGIPDELKPRLFAPFASGRPGGTGLGLALARRIVLLHGGSLSARDRDGGGTTLEIELPLGVSATEGVRSPSPPASARGR